jgi:glucose-6-phosphate 1-epimerase
MDIDEMNRRFALFDGLRFVEGAGGLGLAEIRTPQSQALVSTYAGQVLSFVPHGSSEDLLFVSEQAYFQPGKAIKGGIPVCWPWFGADPEGKGRPGHGFVRNRQWQVLGSEFGEADSVVLRLGLGDSEETREIWPHRFALELEIRVGEILELALSTTNTGETPFDLSQGLHSYFRVGDIRRAEVLGLDGKTYLDKVGEPTKRVQSGPVTISSEVDRIYLDVPDSLTIEDAALGRRVRIDSEGSHSAVVWNPWVEVAKAMADLGDHEYREMLCVETTNADVDRLTLAPGERHRLAARVHVEAI